MWVTVLQVVAMVAIAGFGGFGWGLVFGLRNARDIALSKRMQP